MYLYDFRGGPGPGPPIIDLWNPFRNTITPTPAAQRLHNRVIGRIGQSIERLHNMASRRGTVVQPMERLRNTGMGTVGQPKSRPRNVGTRTVGRPMQSYEGIQIGVQ